MWRHSRWYESDWMIHTAIESAQENSHISAWECSHTAVRETDCGYWGGCWWDEAHPSSKKTFLKEIKMIIVSLFTNPRAVTKRDSLLLYNQKWHIMKNLHAGIFHTTWFIVTWLKIKTPQRIMKLVHMICELYYKTSDIFVINISVIIHR